LRLKLVGVLSGSSVILLFALIVGGYLAAGAWWGFERWEAPSIRRLFREAIGPFALSAPKSETAERSTSKWVQ
jgi:hypothetical protein